MEYIQNPAWKKLPLSLWGVGAFFTISDKHIFDRFVTLHQNPAFKELPRQSSGGGSVFLQLLIRATCGSFVLGGGNEDDTHGVLMILLRAYPRS